MTAAGTSVAGVHWSRVHLVRSTRAAERSGRLDERNDEHDCPEEEEEQRQVVPALAHGTMVALP
jgi:hypothetical protein